MGKNLQRCHKRQYPNGQRTSVLREMLIIQWYSTTYPLRWQALKKKEKDVEQHLFMHCRWECKLVQSMGKLFGIIYGSCIYMYLWPAILLLGIYTTEIHLHVHWDIYKHIPSSTQHSLFVRVKNWKHDHKQYNEQLTVACFSNRILYNEEINPQHMR